PVRSTHSPELKVVMALETPHPDARAQAPFPALGTGHEPMSPRAALRHPVWWAALGVLVVNDHVLKGAGILPGALTGKLSDFAGMIVVPPLIAAVARVRSRLGMLLCAVLVAATFSLFKTWPPAAQALATWSTRAGFPCRIWIDPWDLTALP